METGEFPFVLRYQIREGPGVASTNSGGQFSSGLSVVMSSIQEAGRVPRIMVQVDFVSGRGGTILGMCIK